MDKTIINLMTILITGSSLFAVFTKFYSPQLHCSFYGKNPYQVKKDIIDKTMARLFTALGGSGLLLQVYKEIFAFKIEERIYCRNSYLLFFVLGILASWIILKTIVFIGNKIARKEWLPLIVESQRKIHGTYKDILQNNGFKKSQLDGKNLPSNIEEIKCNRLIQAKDGISRIEDLLGVDKIEDNDFKQRCANLEKYFTGQNKA